MQLEVGGQNHRMGQVYVEGRDGGNEEVGVLGNVEVGGQGNVEVDMLVCK